MGSRREEERNEKIIRGLMKLPPNRRCINCNSLGPQYVCTNFWTFVCMQCSGVHREFTHRVKSVSMAKFTAQEVDALQKGGNQRARELFLKAWDPQRQRVPDNSNPDKVREFIKNVYVDKRYAIEKLSDKPPRDPQILRDHEDDTRRASSYHSYSQSPPYDFQYEERRYGKPVSSLSRKPGSDHGIYDGKLSSFSSPSHSSDQANDERFANDGSWPRVSDYSVSSGADPFRSDVFSPSSQRETWSPFSESETSSSFSNEMHGHHTYLHNANTSGGNRRIRHPQRTASSGSIGSYDSMSFRSVNSMGLPEVMAEAQKPVDMSREKASALPSLPQSSPSTAFNGLDLFNEPFAPQNTTSTLKTISNSQSPELLLPQPLDIFQQSPTSSAPTLIEQQQSDVLHPSPLNFTGMPQKESVASLSSKPSDVIVPQEGGWATFDVSQNLLIMGNQNPTPAAVPSSSGGNNLRDFGPFSLDQSSFSAKPPTVELSALTQTLRHESPETTTSNTQLWNAFEDSPGKQPTENTLKDLRDFDPFSLDQSSSSAKPPTVKLSASTHTLQHESPETTTGNTQLWNAFEDSPGKQPTENTLKDKDQTPVIYSTNDSRSFNDGVYEVLHNDGNFRTFYGIEPPSSSLSLHSSTALHDFPLVPEVAGLHPVPTVHKPTNPFDLPCEVELESSNMTQYWDMSSLQAALPINQAPPTFVGDANESWFPQNSVPSYIPGGVAFDPPNAGGSLGYIVGQVPSTQIPSGPAQGPFASIGGNPFA